MRKRVTNIEIEGQVDKHRKCESVRKSVRERRPKYKVCETREREKEEGERYGISWKKSKRRSKTCCAYAQFQSHFLPFSSHVCLTPTLSLSLTLTHTPLPPNVPLSLPPDFFLYVYHVVGHLLRFFVFFLSLSVPPVFSSRLEGLKTDLKGLRAQVRSASLSSFSFLVISVHARALFNFNLAEYICTTISFS